MAFKRAFDEMFIKGAIKTVAEVGIENTRTKDVADYTGFSEATLFRRFETKDLLLKETFLYIDKQISNILIDDPFFKDTSNESFEDAIYTIWTKVYHYLLDHRDETIFLIRYRYSSLYTDEVRSEREAYNGSFDEAYTLFEQHYGKASHSYRGFLINYIFELTLCFTEKIITGKVFGGNDMEKVIWAVVIAAVNQITGYRGN